MIIIDTNVVSEWFKPEPDAKVIGWLDSQIETDLYITAVTVGELIFGVFSLPSGRRAKRLQDEVSHIVNDVFHNRILPFDTTAAYFYGQGMAERRKEGVAVGVPDGQIASIARANNNATVATRDTAPFEAFRLNVVNPWTRS